MNADPFLWPAEASIVLGTRLAIGDEATAELLFDQPYDAGFVRRHPNQLGGLMTSYMEGYND